jgi:7-cyano-7-deazaguanosine (preQ0) biosynthesis protein QueE
MVSELFGPTVQGEGPSAGQLASFVRLSGCPLSCRWCDTPWTWDWTRYDRTAEQHSMTVEEVAAWAGRQPPRLTVVTGGEPLVQARQLTELVRALTALGKNVEIETSGIITPPSALAAAGAKFNVSPKLSSSGMPQQRRIRERALRALADSGAARFKFVAQDASDLAEIAGLQEAYGLSPVWVMPEGTTSTAVISGMRLLADEVIARGWHLSPRLHVLLWEDARGR